MHRIDSHICAMDDWSPDSMDPAMDRNPVVGLRLQILIGTAVISEINDQEHILSCMIDQPKLLPGRKAIYLEFLNEEDTSGEGLVELNSLQFVLGTPVEP